VFSQQSTKLKKSVHGLTCKLQYMVASFRLESAESSWVKEERETKFLFSEQEVITQTVFSHLQNVFFLQNFVLTFFSYHPMGRYLTRGQFHQHSTCSFYVRKLRAQLFCAYVLGLYFIGARLLEQKLRVERW
jgi:hypothetical protein